VHLWVAEIFYTPAIVAMCAPLHTASTTPLYAPHAGKKTLSTCPQHCPLGRTTTILHSSLHVRKIRQSIHIRNAYFRDAAPQLIIRDATCCDAPLYIPIQTLLYECPHHSPSRRCTMYALTASTGSHLYMPLRPTQKTFLYLQNRKDASIQATLM
jgi:hypothetical protein